MLLLPHPADKQAMKTRPIALIAILSSCLSLALSAEEVTKKTLPKICPKLEIKKTEAKGGCLEIEINIPANEARFKRLLQAWFVISDKDGRLALRVPVRIIEIDGVKRFYVDASPEMIRNARLDLDCKMGDPTMNSLDTVTLVLPSLLGVDSAPVKSGPR